MDPENQGPKPERSRSASALPQRFRELVHGLLSRASRGVSRPDYLRYACTALLDFSGGDSLELRLGKGAQGARYRAFGAGPGGPGFDAPGPGDSAEGADAVPEELLQLILQKRYSAPSPFVTRGGSFWINDTARPIPLRPVSAQEAGRTVVVGGESQSLALFPVPAEDRIQGVLIMGSRRRDFFTKEEIHFFEAAAETFAVALSHQETQWALGERVKELTCLYGIAKVLQRAELPLEDLLQEIVALLPPGWQYPEITHARLTLDGRSYSTPGFRSSPPIQKAEITAGGRVRGSVEVAYSSPMPTMDEGPFLREERNLIDAVAETLGVALGHRAAQWALGERVKELTCLYGIAQASQKPGQPTGEFLSRVVHLLPQGWQYPECARARIVLDGASYATPGFVESPHALASPLVVGDRERGYVQVVYTEEKPGANEGPFLKEERSLVDEVARQVGLVVENCEADEEKIRLQEQLRHADRLATIGQLSAGAAHELNEPLGSILGFAQLAKECAGVPKQARQDLDRIANAALHAREVIRKLMLFARQVPTKKSQVNLNKLISEGLYFLESRCAREGILIAKDLDKSLPEITADQAQMHQVLVNLVVNAVQAMPQGGTLTLSTRREGPWIRLAVEDTGTGMAPDVLKQIFLPFFTTKDVGQGTGLGLSVVHGIVSSHGGRIDVESDVGRGSRFEVLIPVEPPSDSEETT